MENQPKMTNMAKLIKAEINLLEAHYIDGDTVAVSYEFPYRAKYGERRWTKQVMPVSADLLNTETMYTNMYMLVQALRKELEQ